jgi:hypothetical protein
VLVSEASTGRPGQPLAVPPLQTGEFFEPGRERRRGARRGPGAPGRGANFKVRRNLNLSVPSLMPGAGGACIGCGVFPAFGLKLTQTATMKRNLPVCCQPIAVLISHSLSASSDLMLASIAVAA